MSQRLQVYFLAVVFIELNINYPIFEDWEIETKEKDRWLNRILKISFKNLIHVFKSLRIEYIYGAIISAMCKAIFLDKHQCSAGLHSSLKGKSTG